MAGFLDVSPRTPGFVRALHFAIALLAVGGFQLYLGVVRPALDVYEARAWVPVPITAGGAEILPFHGTIRLKLAYEYRFGERSYKGARYAFTHPTWFLADDALYALQWKLPEIGFADPRNPSRAVLARTLPVHAYRWRGLVAITVACWLTAWLVAVGVGSKRAVCVAHAALRLLALAFGALAIALVWRGGFKLLPLCVLVGLAVWLQSRRPTTLRVMAVICCLIGGMSTCMLINPLVIAELETDAVHDPGHLAEYLLSAFSFVLVGLAIAYFANASADARADESPL